MHPTPRLSTLLLSALLALALTPARAQQTLAPDLRARVDSTAQNFLTTSGAPGLSIAIVQNGQLVYANGYGFADLENSVPATSETRYRLASVSKPITAVAAMQLFEQHKLDIDAPIQKYCPAYPTQSAPITTRMLLGHLAGIRHYKEGEAGLSELNNTTHFADPIAGGLSFFKSDPLVDAPGTHFHYSTQGYTLIGCAIASASGQSYVDDVEHNVFVPAGMTSTTVDDRFALIPHRTRFYRKTADGKIQNAEFLDSSYKIPGGGWLSDAPDLARFEIALMDSKLVSPATLTLMTTPLKPADGSEDHYGLGFDVYTGEALLNINGKKYKTIGHAGGQQGTSTMILMVPELKFGVVVLSNLDGAGNIATEIEKLILNAK
jgi:CubicO group peptidase (beta-lactamase class C family)